MSCPECVWRQAHLASMDRSPEQCSILKLSAQGMHVVQEQASYDQFNQQEVFVRRELDICWSRDCQHEAYSLPSFMSTETKVLTPHSVPLTLSSSSATYQVRCAHAMVFYTEIHTTPQAATPQPLAMPSFANLDRVMTTSSRSSGADEFYASFNPNPSLPPDFCG